MAIILDGTSGITATGSLTGLTTPITVGQGGTGQTTLTSLPLVSPVISGTPTGVGTLTSGTAVASTSGTSIDFTGIPSWAKRVTVMFSGVSTNGISDTLVQVGTSGGITSSGYVGGGARTGNNTGNLVSTAGLILLIEDATSTRNGAVIITNVSNNIWTMTANVNAQVASAVYMLAAASAVTLASTLDRIRITTVNGTDTFDAGSINIMYE